MLLGMSDPNYVPQEQPAPVQVRLDIHFFLLFHPFFTHSSPKRNWMKNSRAD
jgi:hypothetical protein